MNVAEKFANCLLTGGRLSKEAIDPSTLITYEGSIEGKSVFGVFWLDMDRKWIVGISGGEISMKYYVSTARGFQQQFGHISCNHNDYRELKITGWDVKGFWHEVRDILEGCNSSAVTLKSDWTMDLNPNSFMTIGDFDRLMEYLSDDFPSVHCLEESDSEEVSNKCDVMNYDVTVTKSQYEIYVGKTGRLINYDHTQSAPYFVQIGSTKVWVEDIEGYGRSNIHLKAGDRVILLPNTTHSIGKYNPAKDSEFFCEGTVKSISVSGSLRVNWDNGTHNFYESKNNDLALLQDCKPVPTKEVQTIQKEIKMSKVNAIIARTQSAAISAAEYQAGKAINVAVVGVLKPRLPMMVRGYADHVLAPVVVAMAMAVASEYVPAGKNKDKIVKLSDMMLKASMMDGADKLLNVEALVEGVMAKLPPEAKAFIEAE